MPTSDDDIVKKQDALDALRDKVAAAKADLTAKQNEKNNDVVAAQLDAETAQLQAELNGLTAQSKATALREGTRAVLDPEGVAAEQEQAKLDAMASGDSTATPRDGDTDTSTRKAR